MEQDIGLMKNDNKYDATVDKKYADLMGKIHHAEHGQALYRFSAAILTLFVFAVIVYLLSKENLFPNIGVGILFVAVSVLFVITALCFSDLFPQKKSINLITEVELGKYKHLLYTFSKIQQIKHSKQEFNLYAAFWVFLIIAMGFSLYHINKHNLFLFSFVFFSMTISCCLYAFFVSKVVSYLRKRNTNSKSEKVVK